MRYLVAALALIVSLAPVPTLADTLSVTVGYRERIALPPDAVLELHLLERAPTAATRLSAQRFALSGTPATVALSYDGQLVAEASELTIAASILSGQDVLFRGTARPDEEGRVDMTLTMAQTQETAIPRSIAGIAWAVTEVGGKPWPDPDPATLTVDDQMNFALFGGCNRFMGQVVQGDGVLVFPEQFAGTLMACAPDAEARERALLDALRQVTGFLRYGAGLVLTDAQGHAVMHLVPRPE